MSFDATIKNPQVALQGGQDAGVNSVAVFEKADLDTQVIPFVAQINQDAVRCFILSHTFSDAFR
jgi:hypothetical protein